MSNRKQDSGYRKSRTFREGFTDTTWNMAVSHAGMHKANVGQLLARAVKTLIGIPHDPSQPIKEEQG